MRWGGGSRAWLRRSLKLLLTLGVTWLVVDRVGVTLDDALSIRPALPDPSPLVLLGSIGILLTGLIMSAWLWGRMALELGGRGPGLIGAMRIVFSANLGRYLPGKLWQIAGLAILSGRDGIDGTVGGTAGVLGQTLSLAAVGVVAAPILLGPESGGAGAASVFLVALALVVLLASFQPVFSAVLGIAFRIARTAPENLPAAGSLFGLRWLGWYLVNWTIYGLAFVLFVQGLGFPAGWFHLLTSFAAAYLLGYLAFFAPAGLGVREGFLTAFLQPQLGGAALGVALLTRLWMTAVEVIPAGSFALWEVMRTSRDGEDGLAPGEP